MPAFICGMQYAPSGAPPAEYRVCQDERQFTPTGAQSWTRLDQLAVRHLNAFRQYEPGLIGIGTQPSFAIGQRALLVCTPHGNVLWDGLQHWLDRSHLAYLFPVPKNDGGR
jgi:hypothetical protein